MPEWWAGFWAGAAVVSLGWVALSLAALVLFARLTRGGGSQVYPCRPNAFAWCTCLGWIATLQETATLAYWCGVSDADVDDEKHLIHTAPDIGAEQVQVAAQDAGLVPEDPDPFAFGDWGDEI